jgi:MFS transporter, DHA3 family, multidrug efflux protein
LVTFIADPGFTDLMTDGAGGRHIGSWLGTGPDRGMALLFIAAGLIGLTITPVDVLQPRLPGAVELLLPRR